MKVWEKAGMSQTEYSKLPWKKMKVLLLRHGHTFWLREACSTCGKGIPPPPSFSGSYLFDAWCRDQAEIKSKPIDPPNMEPPEPFTDAEI